MPEENVFDLRQTERFPERIPVALHLQTPEGETCESAITIDISIYGLQIETRARLAPGQLVTVPHFGDCRVVWVRTLGRDKPCQAGLKVVR